MSRVAVCCRVCVHGGNHSPQSGDRGFIGGHLDAAHVRVVGKHTILLASMLPCIYASAAEIRLRVALRRRWQPASGRAEFDSSAARPTQQHRRGNARGNRFVEPPRMQRAS